MDAAKEIAGGVSTNPKDLDDDESEENEEEYVSGQRELFWDKLVLFLSTAIVALTALDILTELLRGGSNIVCYIPEDLNISESQDTFIHGFCAQSVPDSQYLPVFVLLHGILIGACHYLWKSSFSNQFGFFFSLAKGLTRLREETTGNYPSQNLTIVKKLVIEFSSYGRKLVFRYYQLKMVIQLAIAVVSMLVSFLVFRDFDVEFKCPRGSDTESSIWPYPGTQVDCIFTSLRLFFLVQIVDIVLLSLIIVFLLWGLFWTVRRHPQELSAKDVALFAYTTGLDGSYYIPKSSFTDPVGFCRGFFSRRIFQDIRLRFLTPRICTDLDFLLMILYRSDSGLAHAFQEGQVFMEHKALRELDHQLFHADDKFDEDMHQDKKVEKQLKKIATGWTFMKEPKKKFRTVDESTQLSVPDNIRGAIIGLALRSPANFRAIDVSFGSLGFSNALLRVFKSVASMNFDPAFKREDGGMAVEETRYITNVIGYRCYDDLFTTFTEDDFQKFNFKVREFWSEEDKHYAHLTDFMVIGPIAELKHVATAKTLLTQWKYTFSKEAVLVILQPVKIEGRNGSKQFFHFIPPKKFFVKFNPKITTSGSNQIWPENETAAPQSATTTTTAATATTTTSSTTTTDASTAINTVGEIVTLQCGNTSCDFRIQCYKYEEEEDDDEEEEDDDDEEEEEGKGNSDNEQGEDTYGDDSVSGSPIKPQKKIMNFSGEEKTNNNMETPEASVKELTDGDESPSGNDEEEIELEVIIKK